MLKAALDVLLKTSVKHLLQETWGLFCLGMNLLYSYILVMVLKLYF